MRLLLPAAAGFLLPSPAAQAQRTDDNAVREAQDGFGFTVGDEQIGIYSIDSARGFSPLDAGNVRLDGLYIDMRGDFPDAIEQGSAVKVGITAIRTPLLAPSGVGEITLKQVGAKPVSSFGLSLDSWGSQAIEGETRIGRRDGLSLVAAGRADLFAEGSDGADEHGWHFGLVPRWQIAPHSHVLAYAGFSHFGGSDYGPAYYTAGSYVPPKVERRVKVQQPWNRNGGNSQQAGFMADIGLEDIGLAKGWHLRAGLFRSRSSDRPGTYEFIDDVTPAATGTRHAVLSSAYDVGAWSGEAQLAREIATGGLRAEIMAAVRFRSVDERTGEGRVVALDAGPVPLGVRLPVGEPARIAGDRDRSAIRQVQPGLSARASWKDTIALNLGVQKADYRKRVRFAAGGEAEVESRPLLWNAGLAVNPTSKLTLYAGVARGLEESGVAPDIAANARTALPAAITRQKDLGVSWNPDPRLSLIAGAFSIRRPYANVDGVNVFRFLGGLKNEGVEFSVVARPFAGLNIVAGALRQWPRLSGEDVASGVLGRVPVAFADYSANGAIDYQIPGAKGLSVNASLNVVGPRLARTDGSLRLPARKAVGFGTRYRFRRGGADWALNLSVSNVFDSFDWTVGGDGGFNYTSPRSVSASLFADF